MHVEDNSQQLAGSQPGRTTRETTPRQDDCIDVSCDHLIDAHPCQLVQPGTPAAVWAPFRISYLSAPHWGSASTTQTGTLKNGDLLSTCSSFALSVFFAYIVHFANWLMRVHIANCVIPPVVMFMMKYIRLWNRSRKTIESSSSSFKYNKMQSSQIILALGLPIAAGLTCRPEGPVLPKPTSLGSSPNFRSAASDVANIFESVINRTTNVTWDASNTSFSVAVVSLDQEDPGVPIWEYHHLSPKNTNGTKHINRDSQYLIGSISKAITDYAMLQSGIDIDAPVTKYLSLLDDSASNVPWNNITLRMLGSHLAGVPANCKSFGFFLY